MILRDHLTLFTIATAVAGLVGCGKAHEPSPEGGGTPNIDAAEAGSSVFANRFEIRRDGIWDRRLEISWARSTIDPEQGSCEDLGEEEWRLPLYDELASLYHPLAETRTYDVNEKFARAHGFPALDFAPVEFRVALPATQLPTSAYVYYRPRMQMRKEGLERLNFQDFDQDIFRQRNRFLWTHSGALAAYHPALLCVQGQSNIAAIAINRFETRDDGIHDRSQKIVFSNVFDKNQSTFIEAVASCSAKGPEWSLPFASELQAVREYYRGFDQRDEDLEPLKRVLDSVDSRLIWIATPPLEVEGPPSVEHGTPRIKTVHTFGSGMGSGVEIFGALDSAMRHDGITFDAPGKGPLALCVKRPFEDRLTNGRHQFDQTGPMSEGRLIVRTTLECELSIDGRAYGKIKTDPVNVFDLSPGSRTVLCKAAFSEDRRQVDLGSGSTALVSLEIPRFIETEAPVRVADNLTGLEWSSHGIASAGSVGASRRSRPFDNRYFNWAQAGEYCREAFGNDWRLPSIRELERLFPIKGPEKDRENNPISALFDGWWVWASDSVASDERAVARPSREMWEVTLYVTSGSPDAKDRRSSDPVCVRESVAPQPTVGRTAGSLDSDRLPEAEALLLQALRRKPGSSERLGDPVAALEMYSQLGFFDKSQVDRVDYKDYITFSRPAPFIGHEIVEVRHEYLAEYLGCCVDPGVTVVLRLGGEASDLKAFAATNSCTYTESDQFDAWNPEAARAAMTATGGRFATLSCHERDLLEDESD